MPWEHCGDADIGDDEPCPACGARKGRWTMKFDATRRFVVGGRHVTIALLDEGGEPVGGEPYRVELPDGRTVEGELDGEGAAKVGLRKATSCQVVFPRRKANYIVALPPDGGGIATAITQGEETCRFACEAELTHVFQLGAPVAPSVEAEFAPSVLRAWVEAEWRPASLGPRVESTFKGEQLAPAVEAPAFQGEQLAPTVEAPAFQGEQLAPTVEARWAPTAA